MCRVPIDHRERSPRMVQTQPPERVADARLRVRWTIAIVDLGVDGEWVVARLYAEIVKDRDV